jgi:hypothetical protein
MGRTALSHKGSLNEKTGGDIPLGYDLTPQGILIKNDEEQGIIRHIRKLDEQGLSLRRICSELERDGHKTKKGNEVWHPQTIAQILKRGS